MKSLKNILRSLFISVFPFAALLMFIYSNIQFFEIGFSLGILGSLLISGFIVTFFAGIFIKPRARTDVNLKFHSTGIVIGAVLSVAVLFIEKVNPIQIATTIALGIGWILYLKWYSIFKDRTNKALEVGNQIAEFRLENSEKEQVSSSLFLGNPSIFLFYRGNWCPLCMAQIKEIAAKYEELNKLGINTVLISPQPHKQTKNLAEKYLLNFNFLVDYKNKVAQQLGISVENGIPAGFQVLGYDSDTVMPTVVITDKAGKIIFADLTDNYRVRPEPEVFLDIIKGAY